MDEIFKALSSENRLNILRLILELRENKVDPDCCGPEEVCVCKITARMNLAPSTISHHLNMLKEAGIIRARKEGTWIYYSINEERLLEVAELLYHLATPKDGAVKFIQPRLGKTKSRSGS